MEFCFQVKSTLKHEILDECPAYISQEMSQNFFYKLKKIYEYTITGDGATPVCLAASPHMVTDSGRGHAMIIPKTNNIFEKFFF